ncbi:MULTISPECIES: MFS transporter [unclassified Herbaspirillum]|uniref:MFS transporter n=1 Tax=unclassified Herbaspirillum TaxID=2624150 RepID=UPI000E2EBE35|nr:MULTISPECIES: MFS transporter [unclassified Herbaspirillum]RFB70988.1 MFS transporter [Herbaspirillum sp. 3R-3a1]TFI08489.1 MFS transporter [Herbaspirillum sp. 3R11]TFI14903.1 MFS transporter [Herbaspirillum sp. 3R-11]TFI25148.1 MFS transporter [Herbaspirillum sp. 3C11]
MTASTNIGAAGVNTSANEQEQNRVYAKVFWRIMPFLMLCYVIAYLDRVNVGFAKLQMSVDLGFSETVFGLGAGVFFLGYFLFEVPSNILMHKVGARVWIARIMITWGILSAAFMYVETPMQFYVLRFLLGLAEAGFYPGIILYLTYWYPSHRRAKVIAVFMSGIPVAGILGNPLSGWIMDAFHGTTGMHGWQWMFVIEAVPAVLIGLATLAYLDNGIAKAKWLSADEKKLLEDEIVADQKGKESVHSFADIVSDKRVWLMCLIYFCFVMGQYGLTLWMPTLVKATGVTGNLHIGLLSAIPFGCAIIAMNLIGRSADARRERRWHLIVPALMGAVGFVGAALFADNTAISIAALSLAAAGVLTCAPLFWSLPTSFLSGAAAAVGIAAINSVGNLAGFVSPYLIGYLKDLTHSGATGMYMLAIMLVIGSAAVLKTSPTLVNK